MTSTIFLRNYLTLLYLSYPIHKVGELQGFDVIYIYYIYIIYINIYKYYIYKYYIYNIYKYYIYKYFIYIYIYIYKAFRAESGTE
jgi:hypothetical protein